MVSSQVSILYNQWPSIICKVFGSMLNLLLTHFHQDYPSPQKYTMIIFDSFPTQERKPYNMFRVFALESCNCPQLVMSLVISHDSFAYDAMLG